MQDIATRKSNVAALPFNFEQPKSENNDGASDFRSLLKEAEPRYSQPVEPRNISDRASTEENVKKRGPERSKDHNDDPKHASLASKESQEKNHKATQSQEDNEPQAESRQLGQEKNKGSSEAVVSKQNRKDEPNDDNSNQQETLQENNIDTHKDSHQDVDAALKSDLKGVFANPSVLISEMKPNTDPVSMEQQTDTDPVSIEQQTDSDPVGAEIDAFDWLALVESAREANTNAVSPSTVNDISHVLDDSVGAKNTEQNLFDRLRSAVLSDVSTDDNLDSTDSDMNAAVAEAIKALQTLSDVASSKNVDMTGEEQLALMNVVLKDMLRQVNTTAETDALGAHTLLENIADGLMPQENVNDPSLNASDILDAVTTVSDKQQQPNALNALLEQVAADLKGILDSVNNAPNSTESSSLIDWMNAIIDFNDNVNASLEPVSMAELEVMVDDLALMSLVNSGLVSKANGSRDASAQITLQQLASSDKPINDKAAMTLLNLPEKDLDKALATLTERVFSLQANTEALSSGHSLPASVNQEQVKTDFVAHLKAGIAEIRAQIQQGHQPAIDLSAMVAEAASLAQSQDVTVAQITPIMQRFTQALETASFFNPSAEASNLVTTNSKSFNLEQSIKTVETENKAAQQLAQQTDKAVNIARQEGIQQLTEKVRWMMNQNNLQADIRMDPPELGSMKVRVSMSGEAASVNIVVQSQQARDVLEQATPRLKELLEEQGIELGQSSVQQERQQSNGQSDGQFARQGSDALDNEEESVISEQVIKGGNLTGIDLIV